jgi:hypothetical protein
MTRIELTFAPARTNPAACDLRRSGGCSREQRPAVGPHRAVPDLADVRNVFGLVQFAGRLHGQHQVLRARLHTD